VAEERERRDALAATHPAPDIGSSDTLAGPSSAPTPSSSQQKDPGPEVGAQLGGRYRITKMLGQGGMGAVFLAVDEILGAEVALKFVRRDLAGGSRGIERLRDEVLLAQKVTHPNVCRTYDLEEVEGAFLVKMELCSGETLASKLEREKRLSVEDALAIARQVCAGLAAAHEKSVVHCDLKPQNVMIEDGSGRVVLMDFGIARAVQRTPGAEGQGGSSGTPEYMAPEQVRNLAVDGRADLYALGCMLFQLLVGETPFPATTRLACMIRHVTDAPSDPREKRPEVPEWLSRAILKLLAKDPDQRFPDALAVQEALAGPKPFDWRKALLAGAAGLAIFALGLGLVFRATHREWKPQITERLPSYEENADMPVVSHDGKWLAYVSDRDGTWRIWVEPWGGGSPRAITPKGKMALVPRWTHDGGLLYSDGDSHIWKVGLDGKAPEKVFDGSYFADDCAGKPVLMRSSSPGCASCARLVIVEGGKERDLVKLPSGASLSAMRCDRLGEKVVYTSAPRSYSQQEPSDLYVAFVDGRPTITLTSDHAQNSYPSFTPDGKSVLFSSVRSGNTNLWEIPVAAGAGALPITTGEGPDLASEVTPDGKTLIFDNDVTSIPLYAQSLEIGVLRTKVTHTLEDVAILSATHDGREVITQARRHGKDYIIAYPVGDTEGGSEERIIGEGNLPALSVDGKEVFYRVPFDAGKTRIVAAPVAGLPPGQSPRIVVELPAELGAIAADADGELHLKVTVDQGYAAWHAPKGQAASEEAPRPWGFILPAPTGGWRIAQQFEGINDSASHVLPPGAPLDDPKARVVKARRVAWDLDGKSFLYWNGEEIRRYTVETGEEHRLIAARDINGMAISPDRQTLYYAETLGHVRRQLLLNFADRPKVGK
jgi:hypothetical protein